MTSVFAPGAPSPARAHLILGGARSGKSRHALTLARAWTGRVAFVATAEARDADLAARIARHRAERPTAWTTVEEPRDLVKACAETARVANLLVVDCLTLWIANRMLGGDGDAAILAGADDLARFIEARPAALILVSNEVGEGVHPPTSDGLRYRDLLGQVNQRVAAAADEVTLMVAGIPLAIKTPLAPMPAPLSHVRESTQAP